MLSAISHQLTIIFAVEGSEGGIGALGVNLKSLILQIATFILVFLLLKKFALDKIVKTLDERKQTIDQGVELGQKLAEEKQRLDTEVEKVLQKAREQADKIIEGGRTEVAALLKAAEESATKKANNIINEAQAHITEEIARARKQLERETVELVAEATEAVIDEKLDLKKDQSLIEKALQEAR